MDLEPCKAKTNQPILSWPPPVGTIAFLVPITIPRKMWSFLVPYLKPEQVKVLSRPPPGGAAASLNLAARDSWRHNSAAITHQHLLCRPLSFRPESDAFGAILAWGEVRGPWGDLQPRVLRHGGPCRSQNFSKCLGQHGQPPSRPVPHYFHRLLLLQELEFCSGKCILTTSLWLCVSGNSDIQWCFSQVKGTLDDDVTEGEFYHRIIMIDQLEGFAFIFFYLSPSGPYYFWSIVPILPFSKQCRVGGFISTDDHDRLEGWPGPRRQLLSYPSQLFKPI